MYADDDLQDEEHALFHTFNYKPEMHAYEYREEETRRSYAAKLRAPEGGEVDPVKITQAIEWMRMWRVKGFFKTVQGFYQGNLDLSGRHAPRLSDMLSRWNGYIISFLDLSVHTRGFKAQVIYVEEEYTVTEYTFDNLGIWDSFTTTWKVPPMLDYSFLLQETQETLRIIAASSGLPKVQKLCLVDLPSEILDNIFSEASMEKTRLLSSTCRRLRELGRRHLVGSQRIILKRPLSFYTDLIESGLPPDEYIAIAALAARKDTLDFCDFLENRQDMLDDLESLVVADGWIDMFNQTIIQDHPISRLDGGVFHKPLYKSVQRILASSVNLTSLTFSQMKLDLDLVACVCDIPKLDCLNLRMCRINKQARRALALDTSGALVSSVRYLDMEVTSERSLWYAMLFCPKLSNFSVRAFSDAVFPPPEAIWDKCRFFRTLEYLFLSRLALCHLQTFAEWIRQCSHGDTPYLTHLKIEVEPGITDAIIRSFLRAIQGAPLEVLSIEGALQADLHLFEWIAQHFPHLLGLTIIRSGSTRSRRARSVVWPLPTWQYAQCFSAFSRLEHFGWNNEAISPKYSTYSLRLLEEGGVDYGDPVRWEEVRENEMFSYEDKWTPKLFAIHCPTLRTLALMFLFNVYRILRPSEEVIKIENDPHTSLYNEKWNPSPIFGHWPLATRRKEDET